MSKSRYSLAAAAGLAAAILCGPSLADQVTYENERFGTKASFPSEAFPQRLPAPVEGDGFGWASPDGAQIFIYARQNSGGETPSSIIRDRDRSTTSPMTPRVVAGLSFRAIATARSSMSATSFAAISSILSRSATRRMSAPHTTSWSAR
jgi:hypothetical protein